MNQLDVCTVCYIVACHVCLLSCNWSPSLFIMSKRMRKTTIADNACITLNIGGRSFKVCMKTLESFHYFQSRLGKHFRSSLDDAGELFVDRCPVLFEVLLQSVRSLTRPRQLLVSERKRDLLAECDFYGVSDWLPQCILGNTPSVFFRPEDRAIIQAELGAEINLFDPFTVTFTSKNAFDVGMVVLLDDQFPRSSFNCATAEVLLQRLDNLTKGVMSKICIPGVIVAGGIVAHALSGCHGSYGDVYTCQISSFVLFLVYLSYVVRTTNGCMDQSRVFVSLVDLLLQCDREHAFQKLKGVFEACRSAAVALAPNSTCKTMLITRTSCTFTMFISNDTSIPPIQVQFCDQLADISLCVVNICCICNMYEVNFR